MILNLLGGGDDNRDYNPTDDRRYTNRQNQSERNKKDRLSILHLAEKSVELSTKTAMLTMRQSGKAAYYLIKPKHVDKEELVGLWRMDQQISSNEAIPLECSANIELTSSHVLVTISDEGGETVMKTPWKFKPSRWPRAAKIEFVSKAFLRQGYQELLYYKGQVDRKLAARAVIKIKGDIYRIEKAGWRGDERKYLHIGTFTARRRVKLHDEDETDENDENESEGEDLADEEDEHDS